MVQKCQCQYQGPRQGRAKRRGVVVQSQTDQTLSSGVDSEAEGMERNV